MVYVFLQLPILPEFSLEKTLKQFFRYFVKGWCYNKDAFSEEEIQLYVDAYMKPGALTATINYYRAMMQVTIRNPSNIPSRKISSDTLLIWGENDQALSKDLWNESLF